MDPRGSLAFNSSNAPIDSSQQVSNSSKSTIGTLQKTLREAICRGEQQTALEMINMLSNLHEENLLWRDKNGCNFLMLAIIYDCRLVFNELINRLKNREMILLPDNAGKNIIWHTIAAGATNILTHLSKQLDSKCYLSAFLKSDEEEWNSPLHKAVQSLKVEMVEMVLEAITHESTATEYVNRVNKYGYTALSLACQLDAVPIVTRLIMHAADLTIPNNEGINALTFIHAWNHDQKWRLFKSLNTGLRQNLLNLYARQFYEEVDQLEIKKIYFTANGIQSLTQLAIAHLEFNPEIPLRESYIGVDSSCNEWIEKPIPDDILNLMPGYRNRLLGAEINEPEIQAISGDAFLGSNYQLLTQDRQLLTDLIANIELHRNNIDQLRTNWASDIALGMATLFSAMAVLSIAMTLLFLSDNNSPRSNFLPLHNETNHDEADRGYSPPSTERILAILGLLVGLFTATGGGVIAAYFLARERLIKPSTQDDILQKIITIQEYLQRLETEELATLKEKEALHNLEVSTHNLLKPQTKEQLNFNYGIIISSLKTIQEELNKYTSSATPRSHITLFSFFKPACTEDDIELQLLSTPTREEESHPLLSTNNRFN